MRHPPRLFITPIGYQSQPGSGKVNLYQIEVRANVERHDVHAQQIAREIQQLPIEHLPSLAAISDPPLSLHTAQLYLLSGNLAPSQLDQIAQQLLADPVVQVARSATYAATAHTVDVFFHPGVTDTLAESVLTGTQMLEVSGVEKVETGRRYLLDERLSETDVRAISQALLYNPVIQT